MSDKKLEEIVTEYAALAKDENIDTSVLLINALEQQDQNKISTKWKRWGYLVSVGVPPFGLIFVVLFYFSEYDDGKSSALTCLILTVISSALALIMIKATLSGSGTSVEQLQQIKPADIYQLSQ